MKRGRFAAVTLLLATVIVAKAIQPAAASEKKVEEYLQAFWTSALWQDPGKTGANAAPVGLSKFPDDRKLRISVGGSMGNAYRGQVATQIGPFLASAKIDYEILPAGDDKNANIELKFITFLPNVNFDAACITLRAPRLGATRRASLEILDRMVTRCLAHEMMHVIGFVGHPHDSNSILSYVYNNTDFTEIDRMMVRVLYDRRLRPGMRHIQAIATARDVLVDLMVTDGAPAETREYGQRFVGNVPGVLEKMVADGRLSKLGQSETRYQLALAYTFGNVVAKDEAVGYRWFRSAVELFPESAELQFHIGYAMHAGRGTAVNQAEGIEWYKRAAAQGHSLAQNNLGSAYRSGGGVETDLIEAYKWFELAADRGNEYAPGNRTDLQKQINEADLQEAIRRAKAWKPAAATN
jgi:hypothetical protein